MTGIEDLATASRDVIRAGESANVPYRIEDDDPVDCDDISPEGEFPQFGYFLDVVALDGDGDELGPRWLECPGGLARKLAELDLATTGDQFQILEAEKDDTGAFRFEIEEYDA